MSYSAGDSSWLWKAGIPCLHYGPAGGFLEMGPGGSYVLVSEMVVAAKVLALTALDVCGVARETCRTVPEAEPRLPSLPLNDRRVALFSDLLSYHPLRPGSRR